MRLIIRWRLPAQPYSVGQLVAQWRDRLYCLIFGHDDEMVMTARSVALQCRRCPRRSSGWHLGPEVSRAHPPRARSQPAIGPRLFTTR